MSDGAELVLVDSWDEAQSFMRWLGERRPILAYDVETTGLDPWRDTIKLAQFGDARTGWAFPYRDWRGIVREIFDRYDRPMVAHNMKFDVSMSEQDGLRPRRDLFHDTMTMCALVDSHGPKGLKPAAKRYVGAGARQGESDLKAAMKRAKWDWESIPTEFETYWKYGALDTVLTARLAENLWKRIQPYRAAYELEIDVTWVLLDMEQRGARVDVPYCAEQVRLLGDELETIRARWPGLNVLSDGQVMNRLRADGIEFTKKTAKDNFSLDDEVLSSIDHPLARDAQRARKCSKWSSTYFGAYLRLHTDGLVHANVNPLGAEKTGRMSIERPSMQNIPRLRYLRRAFVPREGNKLVLTDYQAQETRLIAHFAGETNMIEAFRRGDDIHRYVATMVYGVSLEDVEKEMRRKSKQCGHARNYGANAGKLAVTADIGFSEAQEFVRRYDRAFPRIGKFNSTVVRRIRERDIDGYGYVTTYSGRMVRVPVKKAYTGVNYLIQGSGSDALKKGLVNAGRSGISEFAVLPVHDEVVWDIPEEAIEDVLPEIHAAFEHTDLRVPLPIEEKIVSDWGEPYE